MSDFVDTQRKYLCQKLCKSTVENLVVSCGLSVSIVESGGFRKFAICR